MQRTKATFKAVREGCGMSQADIAAEADVTVQSVKKWENPSYEQMPPDDVWRFLLECRDAMHQDAREIAERIIQSCNDIEGAHDLTLDYYRTQEALDVVQLKDGADEPVGYANARMRLVGQLLDDMGVPYTYGYR